MPTGDMTQADWKMVRSVLTEDQGRRKLLDRDRIRIEILRLLTHLDEESPAGLWADFSRPIRERILAHQMRDQIRHESIVYQPEPATPTG